jgi:hypothetical protein
MIVRNVPQMSFIAAPWVLGSKKATTIVTRGGAGVGIHSCHQSIIGDIDADEWYRTGWVWPAGYADLLPALRAPRSCVFCLSDASR